MKPRAGSRPAAAASSTKLAGSPAAARAISSSMILLASSSRRPAGSLAAATLTHLQPPPDVTGVTNLMPVTHQDCGNRRNVVAVFLRHQRLDGPVEHDPLRLQGHAQFNP